MKMSVQLDIMGRPVTPREGYVNDYISGKEVKATPEEIEARQPFERILVQEFGYSKKQIQTVPQFYITKGSQRIGPVDIAIFRDERKLPDDLYIIVETKRLTRADGLSQLKSYMNASTAVLGVWFNGKEHLFIQKQFDKKGRIFYREIPNLPKKGQRIEDIGKFKRKDLKKPFNLTVLFKDMRNHLAGTITGITRDETIAQQIINLLFCKLYDEINTAPEEQVTFRAGVDEAEAEVAERIENLFLEVKSGFSDIFTAEDTMKLDPRSIVYVVGQLQNFSLLEADRDAIREAFEIFIGPALRGSEGQFFTPRNVIRMCIGILDPQPRAMMIDPACGSGGFLVNALEHVWKKLDEEAREKKWNEEVYYKEKERVARNFFRGIDKDSFLAKVTRAYMAIVGNGREGVFCEDSLKPPNEWKPQTQNKIKLENFDLLLTNPPFGAKIKVKGIQILSQYELGYHWSGRKGEVLKTTRLKSNQPPQILFVERCLQFLREEGRMAIVLPEGMLGNPTQQYIRKVIKKKAKILAVVDAPAITFQPGAHTKTCILFLEKRAKPESDYPIFMGIAEKCGHDSRGKPVYKMDDKGNFVLDQKGKKIIHDDFPEIAQRYWETKKQKSSKYNAKGFMINSSELKDEILIPRYYNPLIGEELNELKEDFDLVSIRDLVRKKTLSIHGTHGVRKRFYGTGDIPFIRTSEVVNWEVNVDFTYAVSEEAYNKFKDDLKKNDILFVKDGTYLIGNTCILSEEDTKSLIQSHFRILRCHDEKRLDPFLLLYLLNTLIVKRQIDAKTFVQSTISTIGNRLYDVVLPIPKDPVLKNAISDKIRDVVETRSRLRRKIESVQVTPLRKYMERILNEK